MSAMLLIRRPLCCTGLWSTVITAFLMLMGCALPAGVESPDALTSKGQHPAASSVPAGPTQSDKLLAFYPDLRLGPFTVIADFEDPIHMELVELAGSGDGTFIHSLEKGRKETGRGCLEFRATSAVDELVFSNESATHWHLRRNWRDYDLLLLSVFAPVENLQLVLTLAAGAGADRATLTSRRPLQKGWNLLRLDVAEFAERLTLDDMREIRASISGSEKPVTVYFDDLVLAGNRQDLFGDSDNTRGGLFVRQSGRRWHVGAGGRFELTFANGQLVGWHDLSRDPYRLRNLAHGTTLGPTIVTVSAHTGDMVDAPETPTLIEASTRLAEINALRAVVTCEWRTGERRGLPRPRALRRWTYTIYASGHVFVEMESTIGSHADEGEALAISVSTDRAEIVQAHGLASADPSTPFGVIRWSADGPALLFVVVDQTGNAMTVTAVHDAARKRGTLLAQSGDRVPSAHTWWAHLLIVSQENLTTDSMQRWADAFVRTQPPKLEVGTMSAAIAGGTAEGFNRGVGCYELLPEDGHIRWRDETGRNELAARIFCVDAPSDSQAWVYVNHLIHQPLVRNESNHWLFQLPPNLNPPTMIEVLLAKPSGTPPPRGGSTK